MKEIKLIEAFAGYGSQRMALRNLGYKISNNSAIIEWTIDAIIAYASVHHKEEFEGRTKTIENSKVTKQEKIEWILRNYTLSTEKKKNENKEYVPVDEAQLKRMKEDFINKIIASNMVTKNLGSIMDTKGEWIQYADIFTYSFPCQDLSLAGKMKGIIETSRSGLLFQVERILKEQTFEQRPKILLLENVKNLVGKKFMPDFEEWLKTLEELGYTTTWKVLNAKEHGVPQNRERVFAVSIKNDQDITFDFNNIQPQQLNKRLKHYLEDNVDESYYLSDEHIQRILGWNEEGKPLKDNALNDNLSNNVEIVGNVSKSSHGQGGNVYSPNGLAPTFTENHGTVMKVVEKKQLLSVEIKNYEQYENYWYIPKPEGKLNGNFNRVWKEDNYIGTITTGGQEMIEVKQHFSLTNEQIWDLAKQSGTTDLVMEKDGEMHFIKSDGSTRRIGFREKERNWLLPITRNYTQNIVGGEVIPTLMTGSRNIVESIIPLRIRKITPKEALRLMGVNDTDIDNIFEHITSKGPQYKLAGNSIVVDVLESIFKEIKFKGESYV